MSEQRHMDLVPDWRSYFWYYTAGFLLIPFAGAGIVLLWIVHKKRLSQQYEIHDQSIVKNDGRESLKLDLVHIEKVSVQQSWIERRFNTGTVSLAANVSELDLFGIENPEEFARLVRQSAEAEKRRARRTVVKEARQPSHDPGTLDKMDYLTGLWQQGLISNEDYDEEKKHFE
ncbi:MAG: PH domain-containing protein [Balneolaceae bacterium]